MVMAAGWDNPFTDVKQADWFYGDVEYACVNGLMKGTANDTFDPNGPLSRAMVVTILYRNEGEPDVGECTFADVPEKQWYTSAVAWAAEKGIVRGYSDNLFGPDDNISRQDLAVILHRYNNEILKRVLPENRAYPTFNDDGFIAGYAQYAVRAFYEAGIINGKDENTFDPLGSATRAEAAAMIHRFLVAAGITLGSA